MGRNWGAFDDYNAAAKSGDVDKMLSLRTAASQKEIRPQIVKKEDRDLSLLLGRAQIPESYQIEHVSVGKDGKKGTLDVVGQFAALADIKRPRMRLEESISFKQENGWKIDLTRPLGDPDKIKRPKDLTWNPKDTNLNASGVVAGRIVKTEFKPDYTLVLVRIMDEENAVFFPSLLLYTSARTPYGKGR